MRGWEAYYNKCVSISNIIVTLVEVYRIEEINYSAESEGEETKKGKKLVRNKRGIALSCSSVVYLSGYLSFRHMFLTFAFCIMDSAVCVNSVHLSFRM